MTLRQTLEPEAPRVHEQVDAMLESEDSIIILVENGMDGGAGQRHASPARRRCGRMADEQSASGQNRDHGSGSHGFRAGRVLRMGNEFAAPDAGWDPAPSAGCG